MRWVVLLVLAGSLWLNWHHWHKIDSLRDELAHVQVQNAMLIFARQQDDEAYKQAQQARQEAARQAQKDHETLQKAADCESDTDYLDAVARMWRDKACTRPDNAANGPTR